jgi:transposase
MRMDVIVDRCVGIDLSKGDAKVCLRTPGARRGKRDQLVRTYTTMTASVHELADWLRCEQVDLVVIEATSSCWFSVYEVIEDRGLNVVIVNPRQFKNTPGRRKSDVIDCVWLCKLAECGLLAPSFVPPKDIRRLRQLTRYRSVLVADRGSQSQRLEKLLDSAGIKLTAAAADLLGVSCRAMVRAMIGGARSPKALAQLAQTRMRPKIPLLEQALDGRFSDHHALLAAKMLDRIEALDADIAALDAEVRRASEPYWDQIARLAEIDGVALRGAEVILAEVGADMSCFPTAANLVSWAKRCPSINQSGARSKPGGIGHGNKHLAAQLGTSARAAAKTRTFLGSKYRRVAKRRGKLKAEVAVSNALLTIVWHILSDPQARYIDLGADWHDRRVDTDAQTRRLVRQLERLGHQVSLEPAEGAQPADAAAGAEAAA